MRMMELVVVVMDGDDGDCDHRRLFVLFVDVLVKTQHWRPPHFYGDLVTEDAGKAEMERMGLTLDVGLAGGVMIDRERTGAAT